MEVYLLDEEALKLLCDSTHVTMSLYNCGATIDTNDSDLWSKNKKEFDIINISVDGLATYARVFYHSVVDSSAYQDDVKKLASSQAEEEAKRKAEEKAKRKAEEKAKRKAEEKAKRKAEEKAAAEKAERAAKIAEKEAERLANLAKEKAEWESASIIGKTEIIYEKFGNTLLLILVLLLMAVMSVLF